MREKGVINRKEKGKKKLDKRKWFIVPCLKLTVQSVKF